MGETATDNQVPAPQPTQTPATQNTDGEQQDMARLEGESPAAVGMAAGETAREVAAQHFARLLYTPMNSWSRYIFHENDPHPFQASRQSRGRG